MNIWRCRHVLAHRRGCRLVVADRAHHPAPGRLQRHLGGPDERKEHHREERRVEKLHHHRRGRHRIGAEARRPFDEAGARLKVDLVGHGPGDADDVLDAPRQPVLVLHHGDDDLADPERRDRQVVGAEAERGLADEPRRAGGEKRAHRPGEKHRQTDSPDVGMGRGLEGLHHLDGGVEDRAEQEESGGKDNEDRRRARSAGEPPVGEDGKDDHARPDEQREEKPEGAVRRPDLGNGRGGDENGRKPAKGHEAHDADVEQACIAPLHVHAEREDGRDQPHVEDAERGVPASRHPLADDQGGHEAEQQEVAQVHTAFPLKRPVGLKSRTTTRIAKETANL